MRTLARPKPEPAQLARQMCLGFIRRAFRISALSIRAKRTQFPAAPGGPGPEGQGPVVSYRRSQFPDAPGNGRRLAELAPGQIAPNEPNLPGAARKSWGWPRT